MSAPAVTERVQRLERSCVIVGYRLEVDSGALGLPVTAFARIRPAPGQLPRVADLAARLPQVSECHRITGEDCFIVKVHAPAVDQLEAVLDLVPPLRDHHDLHRRLHSGPTPTVAPAGAYGSLGSSGETGWRTADGCGGGFGRCWRSGAVARSLRRSPGRWQVAHPA